MNSLPFELFVGWRYTRAKRKNHFTSFISITSMVGIALGVAVLIIVLSVMNGFGTELRNRILGVASHMQVMGINSPLSDWQNVVAQAKTVPQVKAAAPYVMGQGMLSFGQYAQGAIVRGIVPAQEVQVAELGNKMKVGQLDNLRAGEFGIVLGIDLARYLGAELGDKVMLMTPNGQATPAGMVPRMKQFKLVGVFEMDMKEYDGNLALVHIEDAAKLYRMGDDVSGVRLKLDDPFHASEVSPLLSLALSGQQNYYISDWVDENPNFFAALKMEKRVMFIIMALVVAVAAFNIVSTLIMAVTDKRADIAIMRTLGASPSSIMQIFVVQGALIGVIGTLAGVVLGVLIALNIDVIVPFIEHLFGIQFLDKDVYMITSVPSQLLWSDVLVIMLTSFALSLLATLYPSWKAARMNPAEALRYE
ncbi:MAG: lipoprotein-releasing ABC transporter permease subunit [Methylotenera sp.]|jgi:lipoprotein-releasing system permease protein|nr:lipoprotein-releasing ABC transporter permease subunit [Methylotenera sp.]HOY85971.1 lipoprotein-releasing ABC transporter permease subunit [Methylotenera sp.]HPH07036.1 lipoprotein-releasing ABC transporter permease subunit [Methylotenera sp.]HPM49149.1 lipoprotein-releasing ABC transporter permease subunit [Methylotenera sp.]HPV32148.1 lipoprotein-releasing ABC transporter permease subunit [Methylotenera sp.]